MPLLLVLLSLMTPTAFAATTPRIVVIAERYPDRVSEEIGELMRRMGRLENSRTVSPEFIDRSLPLVGETNSVLAQFREKILSTDPDKKLRADLVIRSHGSKSAIHSEKCSPVGYSEFVTEWKKLTNELLEKGYKPKNLSFRLIFDFCFAGGVSSIVNSESAFETLALTSTSAETVAYGEIVTYALEMALNLIEGADELGVELCSECTESERLYLLVKHIVSYDVSLNGGSMDRETADRPQAHFFQPNKQDPDENFQSLVHDLIRAFRASLKEGKHGLTGRALRDLIIGILADEDSLHLQRTINGLANRLSESERDGLDILNLSARFDYLEPNLARSLFQRLGSHPEYGIRKEIVNLLVLYSEFLEDADDLLLAQAERELRLPEPNYFLLSQIEHRAREMESPIEKEICARLLESPGN